MTITAPRTRKARTAEAADTPLPDELVPTPAPDTAVAEPPAPTVDQTFAMVPIGAIKPNPDNPRSDLGDLEELAASIRALGIQEPLVLEWPTPSSPYRLLMGHRRLAAAELAGLAEVPCMIRQGVLSPVERMELALAENLQRSDLSPLDEARGYQALVDLGLSQRAIATRMGRSQSHVSKRLALLELPSPVQARIAKGTLPLEAAAALVRLKDHPAKLKAAAGEDPSAIARAVERAEAVIVWEAKRNELVEVAKGKGWPVVDEPAWNVKHSFATLAHWNGPPELEIDAKRHQAEPCHGVMIPGDPPRWIAPHNLANAMPHATSVCTEPARHGPKGASTLKVKAPAKSKRTPDAFEVQQAQERKDRKAAGVARAAVVAEALAAYKPPARPSIELVVTLRASVAHVAWDDAAVAGELLRLDGPGKGSDWGPTLKAFAAQGAPQLHRAALACALAGVERRLRGNYSRFAGDEVTEYFAYLRSLGYEPSPFEQAKLDEAAKDDD